jgi:hypothetical protein
MNFGKQCKTRGINPIIYFHRDGWEMRAEYPGVVTYHYNAQGRRHREDGPALEQHQATQAYANEWWLNGRRYYTELEYNEEIAFRSRAKAFRAEQNGIASNIANVGRKADCVEAVGSA